MPDQTAAIILDFIETGFFTENPNDRYDDMLEQGYDYDFQDDCGALLGDLQYHWAEIAFRCF